jgi:hypothetical protein
MQNNSVIQIDNFIIIMNINLKYYNKMIDLISIFSSTRANMKDEIY